MRVSKHFADRLVDRKLYTKEKVMKIDVTTRALIPTRLIAEAAQDNSRRLFGRIQPHIKEVRISITDRRLKPGTACCQVEIDLADGTAVVTRSVDSNPVEAVTQAFDKAAPLVSRRVRQEGTRRRSAQFREMVALRTLDRPSGTALHQGGVR